MRRIFKLIAIVMRYMKTSLIVNVGRVCFCIIPLNCSWNYMFCYCNNFTIVIFILCQQIEKEHVWDKQQSECCILSEITF